MAEQLGMYGLKYGKSLCHAWGASPIYLIGRYILGVKPTSPEYKTFEIAQKLQIYQSRCACQERICDNRKKDGVITVNATRSGGTLIIDSKEYPLTADDPIAIRED